jgi:hypothetical protein
MDPGSRVQVQRYLGQSRVQVSRERPSRVNVQQLRDRAHAQQFLGNGVRQELSGRIPLMTSWYNNDFWDKHGRPFYSETVVRNVWNHTNWTSVNDWLGYGASSPIFYDSGYVYPIQGTGISSPQQPLPSSSATDAIWLPMGVFALVEERSAMANPNMFLQLVLNKEGVIAGTFFNTSLDETTSVVGLVDPNTQLATFTFGSTPNSAVVQTGIYNLTQDQASALITFPTGQTQNWLMVRLNQP